METKLLWYRLLEGLVKVGTTAIAFHNYRKAEEKWWSISDSSIRVRGSWTVLFLWPILVSFVPWYNVLQFEAEFEDAPLIGILSGSLKGLQFKSTLGLTTYLNTFALGVAFCRSAIRATTQCKLLIPRSSLWTRAYFLIPVLSVVLQWPSYALFGTIIANTGLWAFLLVFTINPLTYVAFNLKEDILQRADTPAKAHRVIGYAKKVNRYFYLVALGFVVLEVEKVVSGSLQKLCAKEAALASTPDDWQWPHKCMWQLVMAPSLISLSDVVEWLWTGVSLFFKFAMSCAQIVIHVRQRPATN